MNEEERYRPAMLDEMLAAAERNKELAALPGCKDAVLEPHPCPYQSDINNDSDTLCTCCEGCQQQCADDI